MRRRRRMKNNWMDADPELKIGESGWRMLAAWFSDQKSAAANSRLAAEETGG
jgi:hypothetical protein